MPSCQVFADLLRLEGEGCHEDLVPLENAVLQNKHQERMRERNGFDRLEDRMATGTTCERYTIGSVSAQVV